MMTQFRYVIILLICVQFKSIVVGQVQIVNDGAMKIGANSKFDLQGNLKTTNGTLRVSHQADIQIQGSLEMSPPSNLIWEVDSLGNGHEFQVSDTTILNGIVTIDFTNNFSPSSNDSIRLVKCNTILGNIQDTIYPNGYTGYFVFSNGYLSLTDITPINTNGVLNIQAWLQGYYNGSSSMNAALWNSGVTTNQNLADSVYVSLHDTTAPYNLVWRHAALLHTNGVMELDIPETYLQHSWYLVLNHRSHIQTWSANPVFLSNQFNYDFSTAASQAYGSNQIEVEPGIFALYSGDINQDGFIDSFDFPALDTDIFNGVSGVYTNTDLNGDGFVDSFDFPVFDFNSYNGVSVIKPQ